MARARYGKAGLERADLYEYFAATHLRHVGNDEWHGKPFYLEDWQREGIWRPIFAAGRREKGGGFRRKHRRAIVGLPRNYGKTELTVAILLTVAMMEPRYNGQYGVIASSEDQSRKILRTIKAMCRADAELDAIWEPLKDEVRNRDTGAVIKVFPYSEAALQSWHFNCVICDEMHVWRDVEVWNAIVSGQKSIPDALALVISTAGRSREGVLWDLLQRARSGEDPATWLYWVGAEDDEDIDDERMWRRLAMPSWVSVDDIRDQRRMLSPRSFERYVLNRWPQAKGEDMALTWKQVERCRAVDLPLDMSRPFTLGVDGATSGDSFAVVAHQLLDDGVHRFREWVFDEPGEDGYYPLSQIEELIASIAQEHRAPVAVDPSRMLLMSQQLQDDYGLEVVAVPQNNKNMCPASDLLARAVKAGTCSLARCPKLAAHLLNCTVLEREPVGWRFGSKAHGQGTDRIDAAIAAAIAAFAESQMPRVPTFAETGGIWLV